MKRTNKYNARKSEFRGIKFDSKKEMERYIILEDKQKQGILTDLQVQVPFEIVPKTDKFRAVKYIADFTYFVPDHNIRVVEDVKGMRKGSAYQIFKIKKKLMYYIHGIEVFEV